MDHHLPGIDSVTQMYSTTPYTTEEEGNGVLSVYVVNELTVPNSTVNNDIQINVFVSMGEDFEVFVPDDHFQKFTFGPESIATAALLREDAKADLLKETFEPQSGEINPDGQNTSEPSAPLQTEVTTLAHEEVYNPDINLVYTGESISSFRSVLKRYALWSTIAAVSSFPSVALGRRPAFPYLRGEVLGAVDLTSGSDPYNYVNTVLLHWVRNAFSGYRGSIRYKFVSRGDQNIGDSISVQRSVPQAAASTFLSATAAIPTYASLKQSRQSILVETPNATPIGEEPLGSTLGNAITTTGVNNALEVEIPYYSKFRFTPGKASNYTGNQSTFLSSAYDYRIHRYGGARTTTDLYVSTGEDFQCYFYTGLPRCYWVPSNPS